MFIPGHTKPMHDTANPDGYAERQQQRYIERQIRKWKRREAAALDDVAKAQAKGKVREWQHRMRNFIDETDRKRLYYREQVMT